MLNVVLDFEWEERFTEDLFVVAPQNKHCIEWLNNSDLWPKHQIVLSGPKKSGKTHLAKIWAKRLKAQIINGDISNIDINSPFVVDPVESIEEEVYLKLLFSLASEKYPAIWITDCNFEASLQTNDVKTRMKTLMHISIHPQDESLFISILHKRCMDFGLIMHLDVAAYIIKRAPLTYLAIDQLVKIMHRICLYDKRSLTIDVAVNAISSMNELMLHKDQYFI